MIVRLNEDDLIYGVKKIESDGVGNVLLTFDDSPLCYGRVATKILAFATWIEVADVLREEQQAEQARIEQTSMDRARRI